MPFMPRHPVVGEDDGHLVPAQLHLPQGLQGLRAGLGTDDPVPFAVPPAQVARDGAGNPRVVVHGHDHRPDFVRWCGHELFPFLATPPRMLWVSSLPVMRRNRPFRVNVLRVNIPASR